MVDDPASLELSTEQMRKMTDQVVERVLVHLGSLSEQPAMGDVDAAALCRSLSVPPPEGPSTLSDLLDPLFDDWIGRSFNCPGPGYLAYVPGGGLFPAALADFIADTTNRYTGVWQAAPVLVQLEANVLDWFRQWMNFPAEARGLLTTGGSLAGFSAIVAARERLLGTSLRDGVAYVSTEAHHSVAKAARLAGILPDRVRVLPVDERFRLRLDALESAIARDRTDGLRPFLVASSAGTTNTGAVDDITAIADIARQQGLWHHVDGAYGAFFRLVPELRDGPLAGIERADSLALDPHKGLFLPYGTGALLVRDGAALKDAHAATAGYMPEHPGTDELYDPSQYGPELSRDYRGLRVWLPLMLFGTARFRAALAEKRELALWAADQLARILGIRVVAPPELSLLAFELERDTPEETSAATRDLVHRVNARQRVMITGASVGGRYLARLCILCFRTRRQHVEHALEDVRAEVERAG